jgi:hypothetical protein
MKSKLLMGIVLLLTVIIAGGACSREQTTTPVSYSLTELRYRLICNFDDIFYVDPDLWPIVREEQEQQNALEQFPVIKADTDEFPAILNYLGMSNKSDFTDEEKLLIYRQHKKLTLGVQMTPSGDIYQFTLRVREGNGELIEGTITSYGKIKVLKREPSINTYPICLTQGTLIDTPDGPVPVERLQQGMAVWTADESGKRIAASVIKTSVTPVPPSYEVVRLILSDGRTVSASAGHPTSEGQALRDYEAGDTLDGAFVTKTEYVAYDGGATYDLLPSGPTGLYRANGILLKSTLVVK